MTVETLNLMSLGWISIGLISFPILLKTVQPYGRHASAKWGPMMDNRWGWMIQESPSLLFLSFFFFSGDLVKTKASYFFWSLWAVHYIYRSFIFPLRTKTNNKKIPVFIVISAILFNFVNGFLNGTYLGNFGGNFTNDYFLSPSFLIGISVFFAGVSINQYSDHVLLNLRKEGDGDYKIPYGGLYKYISCPNFLGEMIEWIGFAIMVESLPAWSFAVWTIINLTPRALDHHRWYLKKFSDYPKDRKALVPYFL